MNRQRFPRYAEWFLWSVTLFLAGCAATPLVEKGTMPLDPLTAEEKQTAERMALADPRVKQQLGERPYRLISVDFLAMKPGGEGTVREEPRSPIQARRHADVLFYRPEDDVGVRALVDLDAKAVSQVMRVEGDQVPLTEQDLALAKQLALQDDHVHKMVGPKDQEEYKIEGLRLKGATEEDPCSKHRCMYLLFRRGDLYLVGPQVIVDLTAKTVRVERMERERP